MSIDKRRIIQELSEEELLALASGAKVETVIRKVSEAAKFVYQLGIKEGNEKISAELIYHHYRMWKGWESKKQSKPYFFRDFSKYFTPQRSGDTRFYYLNPKPFDQSVETYFLLRADIRRERASRQRKKDKKKSS